MIVEYTAKTIPTVLGVSAKNLQAVSEFETRLVALTRAIATRPTRKQKPVAVLQKELNAIIESSGYSFNSYFAETWAAAITESNRLKTEMRRIQELPYLQLWVGFFKGTQREAFFTASFQFREDGTLWTYDLVGTPKGINFNPRVAAACPKG
jgi:hypothetical protein